MSAEQARHDVRSLHAGAWLLWVVAVLSALTVTRNPLYIGLVLLWVAVTFAIVQRSPAVTGMRTLSPLRFGLFVVPVAAILNGLFVHVGSTHLFALPDSWPLVGGPVTLEALVYGALNGLVLTGIFAAFAVFNLMTPVRALVRMVPRAYYPVAVTLAIAVTFVPVTLRQAEQIREAQALRGARLKGLRGWLPLFLPLLSGGLERALQLSEAMVARGFAAGGSGASVAASGFRSAAARSEPTDAAESEERSMVRTQALLAAGILLVVTGWLLGIAGWPPAAPGYTGTLLLLAGVGVMALALRQAGRHYRHTVYRPQPWQAQEWVVAAAALVVLAVFLLPLPGIDRSSLAWSPYPALAIPPLAPLPALATWGLLAPALLLLAGRNA
jgi:energy-coupling factor transport system permease protein